MAVALQLVMSANISMMFTDQRVSKISHITCPSPRNEVAVLNADGNNLSTLSGIECYPALIQVRK